MFCKNVAPERLAADPVALKRIKVAFLIDTIACDTAGTQKQLLEIIRRLNRTSFEPVLICLWQSPWMQNNALPCPHVVLGYRGFIKGNIFSVVRGLGRYFDEQGIDIVQTFFEDSIFVARLGAAFARQPPILLSSRRDIGLGKGNQPWYHRLFRAALPMVNRRFAGIVANSEQVRQYVARNESTPIDKIKVIYNGVTVPEATKPPAPAVFGQHPTDVWIVLAASLTPVKRHDLLIEALAQLKTQRTTLNARLLFLGEGGERAHLEQLAKDRGVRDQVHFMGAVTGVDEYLFHCDIAVLCSDREGLSNAILEYMVCGLPVIATDVGGNPELVTTSNGICVPAYDASALAQALQKLIDDPQLRIQMGQASRARAHADFSWTQSMSTLENYYRSLMERYTAS